MPDDALRQAVAILTPLFAQYPVGAMVQGCSCCVSAEDATLLARSPFAALPDPLLSRYAFKAISTWGTAADFRHFVPVLWDRLTRGRLLINPQTIYRKLTAAQFGSWPEREQTALREVSSLWFEHEVRQPGEAVDVIECMGLCAMPIAPAIQRLASMPSSPALATSLVRMVFRLGGGRMNWIWWKDDREQHLATFLNHHARARLEEAFFNWPDHSEAREWADATDFLS